MEKFNSTQKQLLGAALVLGFAVPVAAFELLSEGAMDSVSAVSTYSSQDIINVMGSPAAGLRIEDGYERLPMVEGVRLEGYTIEDKSSELELTLSKEVEVWAESVREGASSDVRVGYVEVLPESSFQEIQQPVFDDASVADFDAFVITSDSETVFQVGRVDQAFALIDSGVDSITYSLKRFIEHTSTVNARPSDSREFMGSGFVSNLTSESRITIAGERR